MASPACFTEDCLAWLMQTGFLRQQSNLCSTNERGNCSLTPLQKGVGYELQSEQHSEGRGPSALFWKYPEKLTETVKRRFFACFTNRTKLAVQMWGSSVSKQWCNAVQTADSITMCSNDSSQNSDSDVFRRTWLNRPPFVWTVGGACRRATVNSWRWFLYSDSQQSPGGVFGLLSCTRRRLFDFCCGLI